MRCCLGCLVSIIVLVSPVVASPIHDTVKSGDVPGIVTALEAGADINETDGWGKTPLWYAARFGQVDAAKLLIERGADVNLVTKSSGPPLIGAVERKNGTLVKMLLDGGADANAALASKSALYLAAHAGCLDCVTALVSSGADVNVLTQERQTPIHAAKLVGANEVAEYLASHGAVSPTVAPISDKLAAADAQKGQVIFEMNCVRCHFIDLKDGTKLGPNLWGVVNRPKASVPKFSYSETLKSLGGSWTYEDLSTFLWGPAITMPGVKMEFAGVVDDGDRADLIAYLRNQSDTPEPLP